MDNQNQCKPCTDTSWKGRRQLMVMKTVWTSAIVSNAGLELQVSVWIFDLRHIWDLSTVSTRWSRSSLEHLNHHWRYQCYIQRKLSSGQSDFVLLLVEWSVSPNTLRIPICRWEKFHNNSLYYKSLLRCQWAASPGRVKHRARASPHLGSLCVSNRHRRKMRQSAHNKAGQSCKQLGASPYPLRSVLSLLKNRRKAKAWDSLLPSEAVKNLPLCGYLLLLLLPGMIYTVKTNHE